MSARVPTAILRMDAPSSPPLSAQERAALIKILGISAEESKGLAPRRKAALDAYLDTLGTPPLLPDDVLCAARALIRIWAEVDVAVRPRRLRAVAAVPASNPPRKQPIFATLLDPEPHISACTETLSPNALEQVFTQFGYM